MAGGDGVKDSTENMETVPENIGQGECVENKDVNIEDDNIKIDSIENFDANLPETVTLLRGPNNSKLYLIGTAHFSYESQDDVSRVIRTVNPHIVVVELCKSRANILKMDEKTIEEEARNLSLEKMRTIIKENGTLQGLMNILLLNLSAQLTRDLGMAPGGEFRRAFSEVKKSRGCLFQFGDRPIQVTLKRALSVLSWWQRIRLTLSLVFQKPKVSREDVEKFKQSDLLESMLKDMANEYPELGKVFIEERDTYLTYSLQMATQCTFENIDRVLEPTVAVGVVGIGHTPGIKAMWGKVKEEDIHPIMAVNESNKRGLFKKTVLGLALIYLGFKVSKRLPLAAIGNKIMSSFK